MAWLRFERDRPSEKYALNRLDHNRMCAYSVEIRPTCISWVRPFRPRIIAQNHSAVGLSLVEN